MIHSQTHLILMHETLIFFKGHAIHRMQSVTSLLPLQAQEGERDQERDSIRRKRKRKFPAEKHTMSKHSV